MTVYLVIGVWFATATFYFGGKVQDEPVPFMPWLTGFLALIFTWPIALLILLYLSVDGKSE